MTMNNRLRGRYRRSTAQIWKAAGSYPFAQSSSAREYTCSVETVRGFRSSIVSRKIVSGEAGKGNVDVAY